MTALHEPAVTKAGAGRPRKKISAKHQITQGLIDAVCRRLAENKRVRRSLPERGRLHIDRQLPFLCVYRQPRDFEDAGTERLVAGEASYLVAPGSPRFRGAVTDLVRGVVQTLSAEFGAFLIIEIWAAPEGGKSNDAAEPSVLPQFVVHAPAAAALTPTVEALERRLRRVKILKQSVEVEVLRDDKGHPPGMRPLLSAADAEALGCSFVGVVVPPVYRKANSTTVFPMLARELRRHLTLALRRAYFDFSRTRTTSAPAHFHSMGRNAVVKAVWEVDQQLAEVSDQFDYLLQLTPVNARSAWRMFQRRGFQRVPEFHYPPLPVDPALLKRALYKTPIERVEDPALQSLFQQKQEELELKLTMLRDRDTPRFLHESLQLFGGVSSKLLDSAKDLLERLPRGAERAKGPVLDATAFKDLVLAECEYYRQSSPEFKGSAKVTSNVSGLIVSRGKLLINSDLSLPSSRVAALLAHEVGTHLVTYYNGRAQPFRQLYSGLAGYEELQEGFAVLAEHLVGGLTSARMRQLAARVVAVQHRIDGASFVDTFRVLDRDYGFAQRTAYNITMRIYRGGGLTKDVVYLRGLQAILRYVQRGGDLGPLLVGKLAIEHIPIVEELQYRKVLDAVPTVPRYLRDAQALERLERLRGGTQSMADLVHKQKTKTPVTA